MPAADILIRGTREVDWPLVRAFRIENATEHPISFGASLEHVLALTEGDWRMRARRGEQDDAASFVAIEQETGRWVGMMSAQSHDDEGEDPVLTGVYVVPEYRSRTPKVADQLMALVIQWALPRTTRLRLYVYEGSEPAIRFYRRHSFSPTGRTRPHKFAPGDLLELARPLDEAAPRDDASGSLPSSPLP
ncbi:GNAT family N-acetyltransferase [Agromyces subbeticus]|uniref:GNAT family N-acetyltransferase n=1 Tax=Agromyces subbeticus TaxID=293890 RepID=UPI0003B41A6B|nr:GNAT family N-acetyltransferase [Agromyces subbeticus]